MSPSKGHGDDQGLLVLNGRLDLSVRASIPSRRGRNFRHVRRCTSEWVGRRAIQRKCRGRLVVSLLAEYHFELVDGNRVLVSIYIKHIVLVVEPEYLEGSARTMRRMKANVQVPGGSQNVRM